jgi:acyl carrier protein
VIGKRWSNWPPLTGDIAGGLTYPAYSVGVSHAASVLFGDIEISDQAIFLGFSIGRIAVHGSLSDRCIAVISLRTPVKRDMTAIAYDAVLASEDGEISNDHRELHRQTAASQGSVRSFGKFRPGPPEGASPTGGGDRCRRSYGEVSEIIAARLDRPFEEIDPVQPLASLGIDSLMAVELALELDAEFEAGLPTTLLFEALTVAEIVHQIKCQKNGTGACRR